MEETETRIGREDIAVVMGWLRRAMSDTGNILDVCVEMLGTSTAPREWFGICGHKQSDHDEWYGDDHEFYSVGEFIEEALAEMYDADEATASG